jgi:hypothetical protein
MSLGESASFVEATGVDFMAEPKVLWRPLLLDEWFETMIGKTKSMV